jgi:hypothetical protein
MQIAWTQHLDDPKEIERFENTVRSAKPVLERLSNLYTQKSKSLDLSRIGRKMFDKPNWALEQAYISGYRACLEDNQTLLNLDQKDNK